MFLSKYWAMICKKMPDEMYLKWQFHHIYGRKLNIENPETYADKLAYLKLKCYDSRLTNLVDKYTVRDYISNKIGEEYLIPLIGVFENVESIPWDRLPSKYVLKCTHDSASVILHLSDENFDRESAIASLKRNMGRNLFWYSREYPYKDVTPRIICEEFISDNGNAPSDYKIMCFDGVPHYIVVDMDRFGNHKRDIYDTNWIKTNMTTDHETSDTISPKPENFNIMLDLAQTLSAGFKHVRVDFYNIKGKIYFGEMTFFPWGGPIWFQPDEWNYELGQLINIKNKE